MAGDRADRDRGDHDEAERAQDVALAAEPLIGARTGLGLARTLGLVHDRTIERAPARRSGPERSMLVGRVHAATRRRPRIWTIAIRVPTSSNAMRTSATGQAAAPTWCVMLKLRTVGSKPWLTASA